MTHRPCSPSVGCDPRTRAAEVPLTRRGFLAGALALPAVSTLAACAGTVVQPGDLSRLRMMVPASPGGGWDTTARTLQRVIQQSGLARNVQVFNVEGAGGTIGIGQLAREDDDALLMMMGLVMVGAIDTNDSTTRLDDVTPIAQLIAETELVVVPAESPYDTLEDFVAGWAADPRGTPIAAGPRAAPTRSWPGCWPRRSASTRSRSTTSPTPAAGSRCRRCWATRSPPASPAPPTTASWSSPAGSRAWRSRRLTGRARCPTSPRSSRAATTSR